ncbi:hypothetical protein HCN44_005011 [Aphidius gifuensis]|uniref:non-specific serine/threonine protein kinase n=1 Tax=Aphidius gifuensis TaxID=684658 RepID=A0A834XUD0_APHGI|nr:serine/threonine-protein kinase fused [Aphidius gifuensis]XP_044008350.1 serine/threonine-protein kinase fused [Aphidius gifuensis]XP_044008351.1 serine/threonine-protein kinase fused [Aphidius gifuensis]KAF7992667.1 hypothetical protein HCN44_005011 [Aphidius gifuensis]
MDKYMVLGQVGEGSFGQVYKAQKRINGEIVAIKVIRKRGRSLKELKGLRQECEIQKHLHHPNIVQMIDSFETEHEIVVVTEYADKELYDILGKSVRLSEERAQVIACDLVSALYYLHSNRVLHRDLKPQNVLVENNGVAKLCDFGFARSMSTGTHVLTSIKGTPLYMAPELIEECPYDHNADLWSLGCIIYELVAGEPPFQTTSILHLVRLIRFEAIKWPDFISHNCRNFLQGLLQKDPSKRLTWPELLDHKFVKGRILIVNGASGPTPFTTPLSASQAFEKQQQLHNLSLKTTNYPCILEKAVQKVQNIEKEKKKNNYSRIALSQSKYPYDDMHNYYHNNHQTNRQQLNLLRHSEPSGAESSSSVDVLLGNLSLRASLKSDLLIVDDDDDDNKIKNNNDKKISSYEDSTNLSKSTNINQSSDNFNEQSRLSMDYEQEFGNNKINNKKIDLLSDWDANIIDQYIENEEWIAFLQKSMEEIIDGEILSLLQENCVSVFVSPLRNRLASCCVVEYVSCLLSLPFVVNNIKKDDIDKIVKVYLDVRVVPNLVYALKLLMSEKGDNNEINGKLNETNTRSSSTLSPDELQTIECTMLILCRLVYMKEQFLMQFCDAIYIVNGIPLLQQLMGLEKRKARVVTDLVAILNNILRLQPENAELVENVVLRMKTPNGSIEQFSKLLTHKRIVLRTRACTLIRLLGRFCCRALQQIWGRQLRNLLEALTHDDNENVKNAAESAIDELKKLMYYNQQTPI